MEINGVIVETALTPDAFQIGAKLTIDGKEGAVAPVFPMDTRENLATILTIAGKQRWEDIKGAPVRFKIEQEGDDQYRLIAIGHFMEDLWLNIPESTETEKTE